VKNVVAPSMDLCLSEKRVLVTTSYTKTFFSYALQKFLVNCFLRPVLGIGVCHDLPCSKISTDLVVRAPFCPRLFLIPQVTIYRSTTVQSNFLLYNRCQCRSHNPEQTAEHARRKR